MSDRPERRSHMVERAIRHPDDTSTHIERINGPDVVWAPGLPAVANQHTIEEQAEEQVEEALESASPKTRSKRK